MKQLKLISSISRVVLFSAFCGLLALFATALPAAGAVVGSLVYGSHFIDMSHVKGVLYSSVKLDDLNTSLGEYCRENKDIMISELVSDPRIEERFEVMDDIKDELPLPNMTISNDFVKPGDPLNFTPVADVVSYDARILKVRDCKVDLEIIPAQYEKTYLGKYKKQGSNNTDIPFEQYLFQQIILKARRAMHLLAIYKGIYNAAGVTTASTLTGFLKLVADEITATKISPIVTGAITDANVIAKLLLVYDGLGDEYKEEGVQMKVNSQIFDWVYRKFNPITNPTLVATANLADAEAARVNYLTLPGANAILVRESGLGASQRVIATPKQNMVFGCDSLSDSANIETQRFDRKIKVMIDWKAGVQFKEIHARALAVNDQV